MGDWEVVVRGRLRKQIGLSKVLPHHIDDITPMPHDDVILSGKTFHYNEDTKTYDLINVNNDFTYCYYDSERYFRPFIDLLPPYFRTLFVASIKFIGINTYNLDIKMPECYHTKEGIIRQYTNEEFDNEIQKAYRIINIARRYTTVESIKYYERITRLYRFILNEHNPPEDNKYVERSYMDIDIELMLDWGHSFLYNVNSKYEEAEKEFRSKRDEIKITIDGNFTDDTIPCYDSRRAMVLVTHVYRYVVLPTKVGENRIEQKFRWDENRWYRKCWIRRNPHVNYYATLGSKELYYVHSD